MSTLQGVTITRGKIGANTIDNADGICGLVASGAATDSLPLNKAVKLLSMADLEGYGITEEYDSDNTCSVYRHVSEFYRMAGEGTELWLILYSGAITTVFADNGPARSMVAESNGAVRIMAVANTPGSESASVDFVSVIASAQDFYDWTFETFRPCQVVLEQNGFGASTAAAAQNLKSLTSGSAALSAYKVSVCIGQDYAFADQFDSDDPRRKMADVGTMLGCISAKAVNGNIAEVGTGDISNAAKGRWTVAGLSNHKTISEWDSQLQTLDTKGYIFAIGYAGMSGFFWNNDYTCTAAVKDSDGYFNEYTISYGRVVDKAVRGLRNALLPYVHSSQPVDPKTGKIPQALITNFESIADNSVFLPMEANGEISGGKTTVDANSNLLTEPRVLKVSFVIVPTGQIDEIRGTINLKTSI